jgi:hypothetical protein
MTIRKTEEKDMQKECKEMDYQNYHSKPYLLVKEVKVAPERD